MNILIGAIAGIEKQNEYNLSESESQFMNWLNEKKIYGFKNFILTC